MAMSNEDRIQPVVVELFQRMLGLKELPAFLLERYFLVKQMTDKVDARLSPADLARIALDCGYDPNTKTFIRNEPVVLQGHISLPVGDKLPAIDKSASATESAKEAEKITETAKQDEQEQGTSTPSFEIGQKVTAMVEGEAVDGRIANIRNMDSGEQIFTVEANGTTYDLSIDEIDAV